MVGAAVSLEKVAATTTFVMHRVRIVVYKRPRDLVVAKQDADAMVALRDALVTLEKQVREARDRLTQRNTHRDSQIEAVYSNLSVEEINATFAKAREPEEILGMDHTQIASRLVGEHGLTPDAADFAADQFLLVAERNSDQET